MSEGAGRDRRPAWSSGYGGRDSRHKTQNGLATAQKKRPEQICPTGRCWSLRYISPQQDVCHPGHPDINDGPQEHPMAKLRDDRCEAHTVVDSLLVDVLTVAADLGRFCSRRCRRPR